MSTPSSAPSPQDRPLRVFLCHSSGDKAFVRDLYRRLKTDGFQPWLDELDLIPGQEWEEEIPAAVRDSDVVIVCLSRQSVNKEGYLQREIREALNAADEKPEGTIFIIPVRIEVVEVPTRLSKWQWANLFEDDGYQRLLLALNRRARAIRMTTERAPASLDPEPAKPLGEEPEPVVSPALVHAADSEPTPRPREEPADGIDGTEQRAAGTEPSSAKNWLAKRIWLWARSYASYPGLSPVRSKKFLFAAVAVVVLVIGATLYLAFRPKASVSTENKTMAALPTPALTPIAPVMSRLTVRTNVDQADILVDGSFKGTCDGREKTIPVTPGVHTITVEKYGYSASLQQVEIISERNAALSFTLNLKETEEANQPKLAHLIVRAPAGAKVRIDRDEGVVGADGSFSRVVTPERQHRVEVSLAGYTPWSGTVNLKLGEGRTVIADLKAISKPPEIVSFEARPSSIQEGDSFELKWATRNAADVTINGVGKILPNGSVRITVQKSGVMRYTLQANGEGSTTQKIVTVNIVAVPKPVISTFEAGADRIRQGESVKLIWTTQNVTDAYISAVPGPDVGKVPALGAKDVRPTTTTTYTLIVKGVDPTEVRRTTQVTVGD